MQRNSSKTQVTRICASLVTPGLPIALFFKAAIDTIAHARRRRRTHTDEHTSRFSCMHWMSAVLGVQALPSDDDDNESKGVSLLSTDPVTRTFERNSKPYDWRLLGRIIVLLAFTAQAGIAVCQWARRIAFSYQNTFVSEGDREPYGLYCDRTSYGFTNAADTPLDHLNALAAVGGLTASLSSICLSLINSKWKYHDTSVRHELSGGADEVVSTANHTLPLSALMRFGFFFDVLILSRMIIHYLLPNALSVLRFDIWYHHIDPAMMAVIVLFGLGWLCLIIIPLRGLYWALAPLRPSLPFPGTARTSKWFTWLRCPGFGSGLSLSGLRARFRRMPWPELRPLPSWPDELGFMGIIIALWRAMSIYIAFLLLFVYMGREILWYNAARDCRGFLCCYPFLVWKDQTLDKLWTF